MKKDPIHQKVSTMCLQVKAKIEIRRICKCCVFLAMINIGESSNWKQNVYSIKIQLFIKLKINLIMNLGTCYSTSCSYSVPVMILNKEKILSSNKMWQLKNVNSKETVLKKKSKFKKDLYRENKRDKMQIQTFYLM